MNVRQSPMLFALTVIVLSTASTASAQPQPAARLGVIRTVSKPIVRGQTPDFEALSMSAIPAPSPTITVEPTLKRASWLDGPLPADPRQRLGLMPQPTRSTMMGRTVDALLNGTPLPRRMEFPSIGLDQVQLSFINSEVVEVEPRPIVQTVYATAPAYRWYGYGTTRPHGSKSGKVSPPSPEWYSRTGATPGAFPTPIDVPTVAEPQPKPKPTDTAVSVTVPAVLPLTVIDSPTPISIPVPPRETEPTARRVLVETGPNVEPTDSIVPVLHVQGIAPTVNIPNVPETPPIAEPKPSVTWEAVGTSEEPWQSGCAPRAESVSAGPRAESVSTGLTTQPEKPKTLQSVVAEAATGKATVEAITHQHARSIVIGLRAKTEADGQAAIDAIAAIPLLRTYRIEFELRLDE